MSPLEIIWPSRNSEEKTEERIREENEMLDSIGCWTCLLWLSVPFIIMLVMAYIIA